MEKKHKIILKVQILVNNAEDDLHVAKMYPPLSVNKQVCD